MISEYGLPTNNRKKGKGDRDPSELISSAEYAKGSTIINEFIAYQTNGHKYINSTESFFLKRYRRLTRRSVAVSSGGLRR